MPITPRGTRILPTLIPEGCSFNSLILPTGSGSFATCLLKVLHKFKRQNIHPRELAEMACHIEIDLLKEPIGTTDEDIKNAMAGNICRCGAYTNIVAAVRQVRRQRA